MLAEECQEKTRLLSEKTRSLTLSTIPAWSDIRHCRDWTSSSLFENSLHPLRRALSDTTKTVEIDTSKFFLYDFAWIVQQEGFFKQAVNRSRKVSIMYPAGSAFLVPPGNPDRVTF